MTTATRWHIGFALLMLATALVVGSLAAFAFVFPDIGAHLSFRQLRPMHVSAALFWIITGATAGVFHFKRSEFAETHRSVLHATFLVLWTATILAVFGFYAVNEYGGREYWEFPPFLGIPLLLAWLMLMADYFRAWFKRATDPPLYVWMWSTGMLFFLITFLEQNLYLIPWFRDNYLREITVQWKSNGAMVGAWNQMIYGTALFLMVKLSGDAGVARGRKVFIFWFLGLSNLMLNWGHHIYNVPTAGWIRHVAYSISMAEWIFLTNIIRGFRAKMTEQRIHASVLTYRFLLASEFWIFLNLFLALLMSIPAINRYTHGTHITVAHAMGTTIGINTMILLASLGTILRVDELTGTGRTWITIGRRITTASLLVFWSALIAAGLLKGYRSVALGMTDFQAMMVPVYSVLNVFAFAGIGVLFGLGIVVWIFMRVALRSSPHR